MDRRTFLQHCSALPAISLAGIGSVELPSILGRERSDYCFDGTEEVFEIVVGDGVARLLNRFDALMDGILAVTKMSRSAQAEAGMYMPRVRIHNQSKHLKPPEFEYRFRVLGVTVHTNVLLPEYVSIADRDDGIVAIMAQYEQWFAEFEAVTARHQDVWEKVCPCFPSKHDAATSHVVVTN